ncbi:hypothetical protein P9B03_10960 [Metasolibacillus meyeri]|uniref:Membrane protein YkvI n=1 Tax=Metasolibacillus meyeri TaxID=1071052 RepID=A0AAW9NX39_9BACL|nr:hypothetical protein [Metasolibacillus meyeri]MEC1179003.1 hypothetical protein [Metasolibacillus meyeri]
MKKSLQIGGVFVGLIVGAGFTSGQEIMQFFTSFGFIGIAGAFFATFAFSFLGMILAQLGSQLQTTSHKDVIYYMGGRSIGLILDLFITICLFSVAVVMFAGSGAMFHQMFGISPAIGSIVMVCLTIGTLLLNVQNIMQIIAMLTPYLMTVIFIILMYSLWTMDLSLLEANQLAQMQQPANSNWFISALLYVSYNIVIGAAMLIVMGGTVKDRKVAGLGGILGGLMLGTLILLINIALFVKIDVVAGVDMPTLALAMQIHPFVGTLVAIALLGMMYSTAVGMFYTFTVRFITPTHPLFKPALIFVGTVGFAASFIGFSNLVGKVYASMGYLGFGLIMIVVFTWWKKRRL